MRKMIKEILRHLFIRIVVGYTLLLLYWFRYRFKIVGLEKLTKEALNKPGGILFLPNHVAVMIDPTMIMCYSWVKFQLRPMVVEYMYKIPVFHTVLKNLLSVVVPNFDTGSNSLKKKKLIAAFDEVLEDLRNGDNFIIYPAARTKSSAKEVVRSSGVHHILQEVPEANVVLVRIAGLWGSSFSRAITGKQPNAIAVILSKVKYIFQNLLFFTPRREIVITFEPQPPDFPWKANVADFNKYLENWYNQPDGLTKQKGKYPGDSFIQVSYSMWEHVVPEVDRPDKAKDVKFDLRQVPDVVKNKVIEKLSKMSGWDHEKIDPKMELFDDLGLDSLDAAEIIVFLQDEFHVDLVPFHQLTTVAMVMGIASHHPALLERKKERPVKKFKRWTQEQFRHDVSLGQGTTIPEIFLNQCERMGNQVACSDRFSGVMTYNDMKWRMLLLVDEIKKLPGDVIGVMMQACPMAFVLTMAVQMTGKTPMMINWTLGPAHIGSILELSKVEAVLSSWKFVDHLDNVDFNGLDDRFVFYEDIFRDLWLSDKLLARWRNTLKPETLLKKIAGYGLTQDHNAVLVFTSGTEGRPKGVPLTHKNIISNISDFLEVFNFSSKDVILDILPPFHAFGFTLGGMMGLLSGIRVAFSPNLNDGYQMGLDIEKWKASVLFSIPTYLRVLFQAAKSEQLESLRLCVTGMETASPYLLELMTKAKKENTLVEGYGSSESTAVLTVNRQGIPHKGDGQPLPSVDIMIIHPKTHRPLPHGELGLVVARGHNVFHGYLNPDEPSPFIMLEGKEWFVTGDLGYLNDQKYLTITDRMRRYLHIGGETISMQTMEEVFLQFAKDKGWHTGDEGATMAVVSEERRGKKPRIHLFTRFDTNVIELNEVLRNAGFSNIVRVVSVIKVPALPLLGTGQIDYPSLQDSLHQSNTAKPEKEDRVPDWID